MLSASYMLKHIGGKQLLLAFVLGLLAVGVQSAEAQTETVLYSFGDQVGDGSNPYAGVTLDTKGNLYGTTWQGGAYNQGTVFELTAAGAEKVLYSFGSLPGDGLVPGAGLTFDKMGNLYGTTYYGGAYNNGTVFLVTLPNFRITASPTSATVSAGQSTSSILKLSAVGGFSGTVKLSCAFPAGKGLSCGVSPSSVTLKLATGVGVPGVWKLSGAVEGSRIWAPAPRITPL